MRSSPLNRGTEVGGRRSISNKADVRCAGDVDTSRGTYVRRILGITITLLAVNLSVLSVVAPTQAATRRGTLDAPGGYREMTVSFLGGPTTPGAADQGQQVLHDEAGPVLVPSNYAQKGYPDVGPSTNAVAWSFMTRNGANYDVASFTVRYDYLTPQR